MIAFALIYLADKKKIYAGKNKISLIIALSFKMSSRAPGNQDSHLFFNFMNAFDWTGSFCNNAQFFARPGLLKPAGMFKFLSATGFSSSRLNVTGRKSTLLRADAGKAQKRAAQEKN